MTHAADYTDLQSNLCTFFREQFQRVKIVSVHIDEDTAYAGDRLLEITVTFEGTTDDLVKGRPVGLSGLLEERLSQIREAAFPVLSFVPVSEQRAS